ncbi:nucleoside deaminase [Schinkia azotoformans]|uniref:nucleoside deaminase n=1 Tax=Schinkia azotoformans TaxID=1454 RepID=UPI002DB9DAAB|nr:nucleoside deaminase [Schinkia azotoformans]MEC1717307.1 nucleoside deaminase [Schinkia azotoformans]MEC1739313.1 nucleoside deaminase [Schinkia azotoformans]MEC1747655.1 nucleoside deaminase [Schinkia azotoformans]MEC1760182.1 nucleoside deaminase [Schinkia azotoformans]MEC1764984.1 nucleoside deaminase [Schinkia azotoformans]
MDYMKLAADATTVGMANKVGGPFGATIVRGDEVIAAVSNTMMRDMDPSAHAEMVAVREACKKLNTMDLSDCVVYATCEPCPMCVAVMIWAGIKDVYYSSTRDDAAKHGFSDMHLRDYLADKDDSVINMVKVEHREDCDQLFEYFHKLSEK